MEQIADRIESPAPYKFDHSPPGVPINVYGTEPADELVLVNDQGRMLRYPCGEARIRYRGVQAINWKDGESIVGSLHFSPDNFGEEIVVVTATGYGKRISYVDLPLADKHNVRPPIVIARKPAVSVGMQRDEVNRAVLTSTGWVDADFDKLAEPDGTTKSQVLVKMKDEQRLLSLG